MIGFGDVNVECADCEAGELAWSWVWVGERPDWGLVGVWVAGQGWRWRGGTRIRDGNEDGVEMNLGLEREVALDGFGFESEAFVVALPEAAG